MTMQRGDLLSQVKPMTERQERLLEVLSSKEKEIVGVFGPTGTGKSFIVAAFAISAVNTGEYERFILCRPIVDVVSKRTLSTLELGEQFVEIAKQYLYDILSSLVEIKLIDTMLASGKLVIADPHFLRGRTFDNAIIFLDDAQNIEPESAGELLMRVGRKSKFVVAGDPILQKDIPLERDGATVMREILLGEEKAEVIDLGLKDIIRPGARRGARILLEVRMRKRGLSEFEKKIYDTAQNIAPDADIVTVVDIRDLKEKYEISEEIYDVLIISKVGALGRLIGKGGEKISSIEEEVGVKIKALEIGLDFKNLIISLHPVKTKIERGVLDVDLVGVTCLAKISRSIAGPFYGKMGRNVRFLEGILKRLLDIGFRVKPIRS